MKVLAVLSGCIVLSWAGQSSPLRQWWVPEFCEDHTGFCNYHGKTACECLPGFTGKCCETKIPNGCDAPVSGLDLRGGHVVTFREACQPNGYCNTTHDGDACCVCDSCYTGALCDVRICNSECPQFTTRRCSYEGNAEAYLPDYRYSAKHCPVEEGCMKLPADQLTCPQGMEGHQFWWCVPDDQNCYDPAANCPNNIGWCLPTQREDQRVVIQKLVAFLRRHRIHH